MPPLVSGMVTTKYRGGWRIKAASRWPFDRHPRLVCRLLRGVRMDTFLNGQPTGRRYRVRPRMDGSTLRIDMVPDPEIPTARHRAWDERVSDEIRLRGGIL